MNNPLVNIALALVAVALLVLAWRVSRARWADHASIENLRRRQLDEARRFELMYRATAEQAEAMADGYARTIARLSNTQ